MVTTQQPVKPVRTLAAYQIKVKDTLMGLVTSSAIYIKPGDSKTGTGAKETPFTSLADGYAAVHQVAGNLKAAFVAKVHDVLATDNLQSVYNQSLAEITAYGAYKSAQIEDRYADDDPRCKDLQKSLEAEINDGKQRLSSVRDNALTELKAVNICMWLYPGIYRERVNIKDIALLNVTQGRLGNPTGETTSVMVCGTAAISEEDLASADFDIDTWVSKYAIIAPPDFAAITAVDVTLPTLISDLIVVAKDFSSAGKAGNSSYGVIVSSSQKPVQPNLRFRNIKIIAAAGSHGAAGDKGPPLSGYDNTATGGTGGYSVAKADGYNWSNTPAGRGTDMNGIPGGTGGKEALGYYPGYQYYGYLAGNGYYGSEDPLPSGIDYRGGGSGDANVYMKTGDQGNDGGTGAKGTGGSPGKKFGAFTNVQWVAAQGEGGTQGKSGSGGGGGGAGAGYWIAHSNWGTCNGVLLIGSRGGSGGYGGIGGYGGSGGHGGGCSFGMVINNDRVMLENVCILRSNGGPGGNGGDGGPGVDGGPGQPGERPQSPDPCNYIYRWPGKGGAGGHGGNGGWGGGGSGGNGGASVGIVLLNDGHIDTAGVLIIAGGKPGMGGPGGSVNGNIDGAGGIPGRGFTIAQASALME